MAAREIAGTKTDMTTGFRPRIGAGHVRGRTMWSGERPVEMPAFDASGGTGHAEMVDCRVFGHHMGSQGPAAAVRATSAARDPGRTGYERKAS